MKPEDIHLTASIRTSKLEYTYNPDRWNNLVDNKLRLNIADEIMHCKLKIIEIEDMIEKRLDVYVATPDVFWQIVREEAEKIVYHFMPIDRNDNQPATDRNESR